MNAMLKAQMLATALDVYFSDPALGGNKIGAPAPIGGFAIDLTMICRMIDSSGGGDLRRHLPGRELGVRRRDELDRAADARLRTSRSNVGGATWYAR